MTDVPDSRPEDRASLEPALTISLEPVNLRTTVVHVTGELDRLTTAELEQCVRAIEPGSLTIVLDLKLLDFVDSVGLGALVRLHHELDGAARILHLRNVGGQPSSAITMTKLDGLLVLV